jgi:hypothetical protein
MTGTALFYLSVYGFVCCEFILKGKCSMKKIEKIKGGSTFILGTYIQAWRIAILCYVDIP